MKSRKTSKRTGRASTLRDICERLNQIFPAPTGTWEELLASLTCPFSNQAFTNLGARVVIARIDPKPALIMAGCRDLVPDGTELEITDELLRTHFGPLLELQLVP